MSVRRAIQRRGSLRLVTPQDEAFRLLLAARQAFMLQGFKPEEIAPGFLKRGAEHLPMLVITRGAREPMTYVLNDRPLSGSQDYLDREWRAWVIGLVNAGTLDDTINTAYAQSPFASLEARQKLEGLVRPLLGREGWPP